MEWVFDGIGTELISLFVGCLTGGVGIKNKISQHQKGRDNVNQVQIGSVVNNGNSESRR